jgi:hypothetical protein
VSGTRRVLSALRSALFGTRAPSAPRVVPTIDLPAPAEISPGRFGPDATLEVDPATIRRPGWGYSPSRDGALDPGEIVWTWVPFEERDGRGKDRPVLVVATLSRGAVLAVQMTSSDKTGDADHVPLGTGPWDRERRPSWAAIDRIFQVQPGGVRRDGNVVDAARHGLVEAALRRRYGWN